VDVVVRGKKDRRGTHSRGRLYHKHSTMNILHSRGRCHPAMSLTSRAEWIREIISGPTPAGVEDHRLLHVRSAGRGRSEIHNVSGKIHFHEVGAADAIVDIVGAAVGAEVLGVDEWVCSPLNLGSGTVACEHGRFPVPAPATVELLRGAPVYSSGIEAELVTPTGAAIVKTLAARFSSFPAMKIAATGYGAGTHDFHAHSNVLRLTVGEAASEPGAAAEERSPSSKPPRRPQPAALWLCQLAPPRARSTSSPPRCR
jgi:uncharacterized protein (DUF111 family)